MQEPQMACALFYIPDGSAHYIYGAVSIRLHSCHSAVHKYCVLVDVLMA